MRVSLLLFLLVSGLARAGQVCAGPAENHQRLAFIQTRLHEDARRARIWTGAWGAGYGALVLGQLAAAPAFSVEAQPDTYVGAVSSAGALAALLLTPMKVMADAPVLDALALAHPEAVDCATLAEAERLLVHSAEGEAAGHAWQMHAASALYSLLGGLVLGLVFHRWAAGALNAAAGLVIGEVMIFTQPTGAEDTLRRYLAGEWSASRGPPRPTWGLQLAVSPSRVGLQWGVSF